MLVTVVAGNGEYSAQRAPEWQTLDTSESHSLHHASSFPIERRLVLSIELEY